MRLNESVVPAEFLVPAAQTAESGLFAGLNELSILEKVVLRVLPEDWHFASFG